MLKIDLMRRLVVVDSLLIIASIVGCCVCYMFCYTLLCVISSFAYILMRQKQMVDLLCLPGVF